MQIFSDILHFAIDVLGYWQAYATGGVITGIIGVAERLSNRRLSKRAYAGIFIIIFLLVAFFLAWREQNRLAQDYNQEREHLASANAGLSATIEEKDKRIDDLKTKNEELLHTRPIEQRVPTAPQNGASSDEAKRKAIHAALGIFIQEGRTIQSKLTQGGDEKKLRQEAQSWVSKVSSYLRKNLDDTYVLRFRADEFKLDEVSDLFGTLNVRLMRLQEIFDLFR